MTVNEIFETLWKPEDRGLANRSALRVIDYLTDQYATGDFTGYDLANALRELATKCNTWATSLESASDALDHYMEEDDDE